MANFSLTTDHVNITEGGESMGEMDLGVSISGEHHHHETHFRGMDMPGDDSGGFAGHTTSGLAFFLLGTWFSYNTSLLWWRAKAAGKEFQTRGSYQQGWPWPFETMVKIFCTLGYATGEVVTGCCDGGSFLNNGQHITMCGLFLLNSVADLLVFYRVPIPHHIQYLTAAAAFWGESFLFTNHTHGMSPVFKQTHSFLYLPSYFAVVIFLVEAVLPRVWLLPALRNLAICLHGSWLMQSAYILYGDQVGASKWEEDDTMMLLPMLFSWHLIANLLIQGGWLLLTRMKSLGGKQDDDYSRLLLEEMSDSDDELVLPNLPTTKNGSQHNLSC